MSQGKQAGKSRIGSWSWEIKDMILLQASGGIQFYCPPDFSPVSPTPDFYLSERQGNKCVLFEATKFVVTCYSSNRKLIHQVK